MELSVSFPLDNDGFLRRECASCHRQFKWHHGPANEEAEQQASPASYYCPLCGLPSTDGDWLTAEQAEYAQGVAMPQVLRAAEDEIMNAFKGLNSKFLKVKQTGHFDAPDEPMPLTEPDDMTIIASPCHAWEPIKVEDNERGPYYCLVCGSAFAV